MGSYPIRSSQTPAVRWIGRVNIDTIRFNLDLQALVRILSNRIADKQHIVT
jgi:predicted phage tail protein